MACRGRALGAFLAERNSKRNHGRAAFRTVHAPLVSARPEHRGNSRRVACRENLATRERANANALPRAEPYPWFRCTRAKLELRSAPAEICPVDWSGSRLLVGRLNRGSAPH